MITFTDIINNKLYEEIQPSDTTVATLKFMGNLKTKKDTVIKTIVDKKAGKTTGTGDNTSVEAKSNGITLKINTNFTIESEGYKYDMLYATTGKDKNIPLYYVKSDDKEIVNISGITFIEDKDWNNVKGLFEILNSWKTELQKTTSPVDQPISEKHISSYSDFLSEDVVPPPIVPPTKTPVPPTKTSVPPTKIPSLASLNNAYMIQIGNPTGLFVKLPRFNEVDYTINKLMFGKTSKYKLNNIKYNQFTNLENSLQPVSKKIEFSTKWYIGKSVSVQGDQHPIVLKFGKTINPGDMINICKYDDASETKVDLKVSSVQIKTEVKKF